MPLLLERLSMVTWAELMYGILGLSQNTGIVDALEVEEVIAREVDGCDCKANHKLRCNQCMRHFHVAPWNFLAQPSCIEIIHPHEDLTMDWFRLSAEDKVLLCETLVRRSVSREVYQALKELANKYDEFLEKKRTAGTSAR